MADGLALFRNIDRMEDAHSQIATLIDRLDRNTHLEEVGQLVSGMGGLLGSFSRQHSNLQNEMKAMLESSRNGLLSHEQIVEMVNNEMKRSAYLTNIVESIKMQIEALFNTIVNSEALAVAGTGSASTNNGTGTGTGTGTGSGVAHGEDDMELLAERMISTVTDNVNLMWKSVNSLATIIDSSPKTLDSNMRKIDSELIVQLNQAKLRHSQSAEVDFEEKLEQAKEAFHKKRLTRSLSSDSFGAQGLSVGNNSQASQRVNSMTNNTTSVPLNSTDVNNNNNNNETNSNKTNNGINNNTAISSSNSSNKYSNNNASKGDFQSQSQSAKISTSSEAQGKKTLLSIITERTDEPPHQRSKQAHTQNTRSSANDNSSTTRLPADQTSRAPHNASTQRSVPPAMTDEDQIIEDEDINEESKSVRVISTAKTNPHIGKVRETDMQTHTQIQAHKTTDTGGDSQSVSSENALSFQDSFTSSQFIPAERDRDSESVSVSVKPTRKLNNSASKSKSNGKSKKHSSLTPHNTATQLESSSSRAPSGSGKHSRPQTQTQTQTRSVGFHAHSESESEREREKAHTHIQSLFPQGLPADVDELMRILRDREAVLIKREAQMEVEVKQRVKEYIRDHGIGFQKKPTADPLAGDRSASPDPLHGTLLREKSLRTLLPPPQQTSRSRLSSRNGEREREKDDESMTSSQRESGLSLSPSRSRTPRTPSSLASRTQNHNHSFTAEDALRPRTSSPSTRRTQTNTNANNRPSSRSLIGPDTHTSSLSHNAQVSPWQGLIDAETVKSRLHVQTDDPNRTRIFDIVDVIVNNINYRHTHSRAPSRSHGHSRAESAAGGDNSTNSSVGNKKNNILRKSVLAPIGANTNNNSKNNNDNNNNSTLALDGVELIKIVTPFVPIKIDVSTSTDDLSLAHTQQAREPFDLPIYDTPAEFLTTRTYKITPELRDLWQMLRNSPHALITILDEFSPFLSPIDRQRLQFAAWPYVVRTQTHTQQENAMAIDSGTNSNGLTHSTHNSANNNNNNNKPWFTLSETLQAEMHTLLSECEEMLPLLRAAESLAENVVHFVKALRKAGVATLEDLQVAAGRDEDNVQLLQKMLIDLYRLFGDLQARELACHLRLYEFRAFFERVRAQSEKALSQLFQDFPSMEKCFAEFTRAQGYAVEVHRRLLACRDRCHRYEVFRLMLASQQQLSQQLSSPALVHESAATLSNHPPLSFSLSPSYTHALSPTHRERTVAFQGVDERRQHSFGEMNQAVVKRLENALAASEQRAEDLENELLELLREKDQTPGALLFFSLLHDASFVPSLQQLNQQLAQFKAFLDGKEHVDYALLRRRMQVCLSLRPTLDKLIDKYAALYKRWAQHRVNFFAEKKLRGSAADVLASCPLCYSALLGPGVVSSAAMPEHQEPPQSQSVGRSRVINNASKMKSRLSNAVSASSNI